MKKTLMISAALLASSVVFAESEMTYSVDEYCGIADSEKSSVYHKRLLKVYGERLGEAPNRSTCKQLKMLQQIAVNADDRAWDYKFNKPYAGSIIRLSDEQVEKLRKARIKESEFKQLLGSLY